MGWIEKVSTYKYSCIITDQNLSFNSHTENLVSKLKEIGFLFLEQIQFLPPGKEPMISAAIFFLMLDNTDLLFMNAPD